jgi:hypothetical protein
MLMANVYPSFNARRINAYLSFTLQSAIIRGATELYLRLRMGHEELV